MRFEKKVVVVTGGASGIGLAAVERFAAEGASVIAVDVNETAGESEASRLSEAGHRVEFFRASVADEEEVAALYNHIASTHGRIDVLFNNAGIALPSLGASTPLNEWRQVMAVNVDGAYLMARHAIQMMLRAGSGGAIVNTSSICGHIANVGGVSYNASKHAIEGITKSLALEHARDGIRVNAVAPGHVMTEMGKIDLAADPSIPDLHPLGRIAEPSEIAAAVAFLASDDASFVTGTSLLVDGGYTAK